MYTISEIVILIRDQLTLPDIYLNEKEINTLIKPLNDAIQSIWTTPKSYVNGANDYIKNARAGSRNIAVGIRSNYDSEIFPGQQHEQKKQPEMQYISRTIPTIEVDSNENNWIVQTNNRLKATLEFLYEASKRKTMDDYPNLVIALTDIYHILREKIGSGLRKKREFENEQRRREALAPEFKNPESALIEFKSEIRALQKQLEQKEQDRQTALLLHEATAQEKSLAFHIARRLYGFYEHTRQLAQPNGKPPALQENLADIHAQALRLGNEMAAEELDLNRLFSTHRQQRRLAFQRMTTSPGTQNGLLSSEPAQLQGRLLGSDNSGHVAQDHRSLGSDYKTFNGTLRIA